MVEQDFDKALDALKQDVRELRAAFTRWARENGQRHIAQRMEAVRGRIREGVEHGMSQVREGVDRGIGWARTALEGAQDRCRHAAEGTRKRVASHPWLSVGGGVLAGVIIGRLLLRR